MKKRLKFLSVVIISAVFNGSVNASFFDSPQTVDEIRTTVIGGLKVLLINRGECYAIESNPHFDTYVVMLSNARVNNHPLRVDCSTGELTRIWQL